MVGSDYCGVPRSHRQRRTMSRVESIRLRVCQYDEIAALQRQVLRPKGPLPGDELPSLQTIHLGAFLATGDCVGACSVAPVPVPESAPELHAAHLPPPVWQLFAMAVSSDARGRGIGSRMADLAVATASEWGAGGVWAAARLSAVGFYQSHGWRAVGGVWEKSGVGPHRYVYFDGDTAELDSAASAFS